ncbi:hypothetical protein L211DRAFT_37739 [Terfezia boudieri ATCC MYA-4762]|uniref:Uncharacterized protein n=1 Tax=Terfezia boudieri ATCC MYA-4762 TaxID=1051890 RepID=A0A3N4MBS2_9PEZI|nr:hypothetical protein L211DRAFT_37739 [Terfezia boudieri ATCC MYA-4762]
MSAANHCRAILGDKEIGWCSLAGEGVGKPQERTLGYFGAMYLSASSPRCVRETLWNPSPVSGTPPKLRLLFFSAPVEWGTLLHTANAMPFCLWPWLRWLYLAGRIQAIQARSVARGPGLSLSSLCIDCGLCGLCGALNDKWRCRRAWRSSFSITTYMYSNTTFACAWRRNHL